MIRPVPLPALTSSNSSCLVSHRCSSNPLQLTLDIETCEQMSCSTLRGPKRKLADLSINELEKLVAKREREARLRCLQAPPLSFHHGAFLFGSACTGWATEAQVCCDLGLTATHLFACDISASSKKFVNTNFAIGTWVDDVFSREFANLPSVDFFFCRVALPAIFQRGCPPGHP